MNNTTMQHKLVNKNLPLTFKVGQSFVIKVASTIIGRITIVTLNNRLYASLSTRNNGTFNLSVDPYLLSTSILKGYAIYEVVPQQEEGVIKTEQTQERYIVWCPASTSPCQQIFTSARQARYVAYRMSEEHKGKVFHWAKLEGSAHWGSLE